MRILITGLAALLLAGVIYHLVTNGSDDASEQLIEHIRDTPTKNVVHTTETTPVKHAVFYQPDASAPQYSVAKSILDDKRAQLAGTPRTRLLTTDRQLVGQLFEASEAIIKGKFDLGKQFDVTLFDDQPCSFDALLHPMTKAGTFWVLQAKCQQRTHKNSVRMILSPENNQLYISISDRGQPQAKSVHLTGDYVMALDEEEKLGESPD